MTHINIRFKNIGTTYGLQKTLLKKEVKRYEIFWR